MELDPIREEEKKKVIGEIRIVLVAEEPFQGDARVQDHAINHSLSAPESDRRR